MMPSTKTQRSRMSASYTRSFSRKAYTKLSPDAKAVLDAATELLKKSIKMRAMLAEGPPEYHLDSFDAGYAQLKLVWKEYFKKNSKRSASSIKRSKIDSVRWFMSWAF